MRDFTAQYREVLKELPKVFSEIRESELEREIVRKFNIGLETLSLLKLDFRRDLPHLFIENLIKKSQMEKYLSDKDDRLFEIYNILRDPQYTRSKLEVLSDFINLLEEKIMKILEVEKGKSSAIKEAKIIVNNFKRELDVCISELILSDECSKLIAEKIKGLEHAISRERKIKYFSKEEINNYEVVIDGNGLLIYAKTRQVVNLPRIDVGDKEHMFLVNEDGRLYILKASNFDDEFDLFHSSFCFEKIKAAGGIYVGNGIIRMVSNISGHFLPREETLVEFARTISKLAHLAGSHDKLNKHKDYALRGFLCNGEYFTEGISVHKTKVACDRALLGR